MRILICAYESDRSTVARSLSAFVTEERNSEKSGNMRVFLSKCMCVKAFCGGLFKVSFFPNRA